MSRSWWSYRSSLSRKSSASELTRCSFSLWTKRSHRFRECLQMQITHRTYRSLVYGSVIIEKANQIPVKTWWQPGFDSRWDLYVIGGMWKNFGQNCTNASVKASHSNWVCPSTRRRECTTWKVPQSSIQMLICRLSTFNYPATEFSNSYMITQKTKSDDLIHSQQSHTCFPDHNCHGHGKTALF